MKVTHEWLVRHKSKRGGWNFCQLAVLGESWPPQSGWMDRAAGKDISDHAAALFVEYGIRPPRKDEELSLKKKAKTKFRPTNGAKRLRQKSNEANFLQTYEWRRLRMQALKKYGNRCQCCGASPKDGAIINVDHIKPRKLYPSLALDLNNLQILCSECNHGKGNWDMTDWRWAAIPEPTNAP